VYAEPKNIVIATGSSPRRSRREVDEQAHRRFDRRPVAASVPEATWWSSARRHRPGAGLGLARLGAEVTVVEYLDRVCPAWTSEVAKQFQRSLTKQGFKFKLGQPRSPARRQGKAATLTIEPARAARPKTLAADYRARGHRPPPYTARASASTRSASRSTSAAVIDRRPLQDLRPGIYAIGDVIAGPMLAHKAEDEGVASPR
jgi:dihydrolipoamide dehydrogenase